MILVLFVGLFPQIPDKSDTTCWELEQIIRLGLQSFPSRWKTIRSILKARNSNWITLDPLDYIGWETICSNPYWKLEILTGLLWIKLNSLLMENNMFRTLKPKNFHWCKTSRVRLERLVFMLFACWQILNIICKWIFRLKPLISQYFTFHDMPWKPCDTLE